MPAITLPDGSQRVFDNPVSVADVAADIGAGLAKATLAGVVNGEVVDASYIMQEDSTLAIVTDRSDEALDIIRHSSAHLLAMAVKQLFPAAQVTIGPVIEDGFYYDFAFERTFTPEDLEAIEARMTELVQADHSIAREEWDRDEAVAFFREMGEEYKAEIIASIPAGEPIGLYRQGDFIDLCRGPHVPSTAKLPAFKLTKVAGAYWRGDSNNEMLQRIYGTAWPSQDELNAHLELLAEAEKRDHRRLGTELDLFSFPEEIGSGLAVFHPKGGIIRRAMEDYSRKRHEEEDYEFVYSPHLTKATLFEKSGHLDWYSEGMYPPMIMDEELHADGTIKKPGQQYYMKPMNCPFHNLIFQARQRSYRELPLRLFEFGTVYRYEKSGVLHGITRARGFTQDDAHIYCTKEQMADELDSLLTFVLNLLRDYGLNDFYLELSTKNPEKFVGEDSDWQEATETLRKAAVAQNLELVLDEGGAAFYGPKISVQAKDAIGRTWQMSTIQVDFQLPQRFELEYSAADGSRQRPVMIHRALFGSIERFFGVLTEHYSGAFPPWLAPVQAVGIPVAEAFADYLADVIKQMKRAGIRAELDASDDRMQKKVRNAQMQKVPFMVIAGEEDMAAGAVSFRYRNGEQKNGIPIAQAIAEIQKTVAERTQV